MFRLSTMVNKKKFYAAEINEKLVYRIPFLSVCTHSYTNNSSIIRGIFSSIFSSFYLLYTQPNKVKQYEVNGIFNEHVKKEKFKVKKEKKKETRKQSTYKVFRPLLLYVIYS